MLSRALLLFPLALCFVADPSTADETFRDMLRDLNERYEDFFIHFKERQVWEQKVLRGKEQYKAEVARERRLYEQARLEYMKRQRLEPDMTPFERQHEAEKKVEERRMELARQQFVRERKELERIERSARHIPVEDELELYTEWPAK